MKSKTITILGTKGVGKTTLFRQITKRYCYSEIKSGSNPLINYAENLIKLANNIYKLIDTPSFIFSPLTEIEKAISNQIESLLAKSDLILWVVDGIAEKTLLLKKYLKKIKVSQILVINKGREGTENYQILRPQYFFLFKQKTTDFDELEKQITTLIPSPINSDNCPEKEKLNLLIFGPPNSGKSTLMNYLLKENRSLVTPIAGTTQEPVIGQWNWTKINFHLVDTAGITKEQKLKESVWSKCDLAWAVIDVTLPLTKQILQIINLGEKHSKPLIIIINKCDLVTEQKLLRDELKNRLKSLNYVPIVYTSALQGTGVKSLLKILEKMLEQSKKKLSKKKLAETVEKMLLNNPPKYFKGNKLKIYFAKHEPSLVQVFIFFVNNPQWVHFSYQRYITNYLRKSVDLEHLPIKIIFKKSKN